ncbi:MAG: T9SS type A sorting domain-containing protein [Bacteroidota bacterium]
MKRIILASCLLLSLTTQATAQYLSQIESFSTVVSNDVAIDAAGNAYVTGSISGSTEFLSSGSTTAAFTLQSIGLKDVFVAKYDPAGDPVWGFSIGGIAAGPGIDDEGLAIEVSSAGHVFVTGYFQGTADFDPGNGVAEITSNGFRDAFMASYTADGELRWARGFGGTADDRGQDVGVHSTSAVVFTGFFRETGTLSSDPTDAVTSAGEEDGYVISMDPEANLNWLFHYGDFSVDKGNRIATDDAGNVYLLGVFSRNANLDPSGSADALSSLNGSQDGVLASYTPAGVFRWAIPIGGAQLDGTTGLAVDAAGNAFLTGFFIGTVDFAPLNGPQEVTSTGRDQYIARYTPTGTLAWVFPLGTGFAQGSDIGLNSNGDLIVSGFFAGEIFPNPQSTLRLTSNGEQDLLLASYDSNGSFRWANALGGPLTEVPTGVALNEAGNAYLTGYFQDEVDFDVGADTLLLASAGSFDGFVARFAPNGSISVANENEPPLATTQFTVYPNPAVNRVILNLTPGNTGADKIEIVDLLGRIVYTRAYSRWAGISQQLDIPVSNLPAGVYIIRMQNEPGTTLPLTIVR